MTGFDPPSPSNAPAKHLTDLRRIVESSFNPQMHVGGRRTEITLRRSGHLRTTIRSGDGDRGRDSLSVRLERCRSLVDRTALLMRGPPLKWSVGSNPTLSA